MAIVFQVLTKCYKIYVIGYGKKKKTHQTLSLGRGPYFQTSNASGLIISPEFGKAFRKRKPGNREIDPWLSVTQQQQQKSQVKSKLILNFFPQGSSIAKFPKGRLCWLILSSLLAQFITIIQMPLSPFLLMWTIWYKLYYLCLVSNEFKCRWNQVVCTVSDRWQGGRTEI